MLGHLTNCGRNNSIFTGEHGKQVDVSGWSVKGDSMEVFDYYSAVDAIRFIVEQGEGSDPCNPVAWNQQDNKDLSHYFLFYSIVEKHEIQVLKKMPKIQTMNRLMLDYSKVGRELKFLW